MRRPSPIFPNVFFFGWAFCWVSGVAMLASPAVGQTFPIDLATSPLPRGAGLSAGYEGDVGIDANAAVIFADNFEAGDYLTKWDAGNNRSLLSLVDESASSPVLGNRSLRAGADTRQYGGSGLIEWFPSADSVYIRFDVKFDEQSTGFWHLVRLRANRGLTGADKWSGFGQAGVVPDGTDFFTTGVEPFGRTPESPGRWGSYTYWPDMQGQYGQTFLPDNVPLIEKDQWMSVEFMVKHNTPGEDDGEQAIWINGELVGQWGGFNWRTSPTLWANAFILETYLQGPLATANNVAFFDNVVIASEYVGPSGVAVPEPTTGALWIMPLLLLGATRLVSVWRRK